MSSSRRQGEAAFGKIEKCNSELFSLTYGAIVTQLIKDYEEVDATNAQLEKMCVPAAEPSACAFLFPLPCPCATPPSIRDLTCACSLPHVL